MYSEKPDVLIVGAGPAGLSAAFNAASRGSSVVVIDRKKNLGEPVHCAEASFLPLLEMFDIHNGPWVINRYHKIKVHTPKKTFEVKATRLGPVALDRRIMEKELAERAKGAGAEIVMGSGALSLEDGVLKTRDSEFKPRVVIGADGIESCVARWAGMSGPLSVEDVGSSAQYLLKGTGWEADTMEVFIRNETAPGGYAWVFPKSEDMANVGIMIQGHLGRAVDLLEDFVCQRFDGAKRMENKGGCVPTALPLESLVKNNIMVAGDAARLAFPFGGAGIHTALFSGAVAGRIAGESIGGGGGLWEYDKICKACLGKSIRRNYGLKNRTFSSPKGVERTARMLGLGTLFINTVPFNPMKRWWGKMKKYA